MADNPQDSFPGLPEDIYKYRNEFDYSVWIPNSEITCCSVPWDSSYRDIVRFDNEQARNTYFADLYAYSYSFRLSGFAYLKYNEPIRVNAPFSMVNQCNYIIVRNPIQPIPDNTDGQTKPSRKPDTFYYFINDVRYIAPNTTELNIQLDVWQTYYDRITWGLSYINKGHIGIANEKSTNINLSEYLTDEEGLDIGAEYEIVNSSFYSFQNTAPYVVIMSTVDLSVDFGDVDNPILTTAPGSINDSLPGGCSVFAVEAGNFVQLMGDLSQYPWISQCITFITVVPKIFCQVSESVTIADRTPAFKLQSLPSIDGELFNVPNLFNNFKIPERYRNLLKFFTFPYTCIEMSGLNGGEIILKNECQRPVFIDGSQGFQLRTKSICSPPEIRGYVFPDGYNAETNQISYDVNYVTPDGNTLSSTFYPGEFLDLAIQYTNFPQLSLVNNQYINYLASNIHSRNYAFESANWSQQKSMAGANISYNQASQAIDTAAKNQQVANNASWTMNDIAQEKNTFQGATSTVNNALNTVGNILTGNIGGAVSGAVNTASSAVGASLNSDWINRTTSSQVGAATQTTRNNAELSRYNRDTNYDYATFAAKGDYENAIEGIQAKVQDAKLTQPSTSGQNGGDAFNLANGYCGVLLKWKRLKLNYIRQIGDFWLRYGYYVNRWITPPNDLACMSNFTYWKMQEAVIRGYMPELFKEAIRGIFEKGVTVWKDPTKIGIIDLANNEIKGGISY